MRPTIQPRRTYRSVGLVAGSLAAVLLITSCQGGGQPAIPPSATGSTTAAPPSATSTRPVPQTGAYKPADAHGKAQNVPVPVMPELAKENSREGLEAFIRYWYAQLSYGYETGEVSGFASLSGPNCALCSSLRQGILDAWADGRWVSGGTLKSATIETNFDGASNSQVATVQVLQKTTEIRDPDGSLFQDPTLETNSASRATIEYSHGGWIMADLGLVR